MSRPSHLPRPSSTHSPPDPSGDLRAGHGQIMVSTHAGKAVFEELVAAYPLKLLSPRAGADGVAVAYILSYGGGLIGGDEVVLGVEVRNGAKLVLLSQGSTKVFKLRMGGRLANTVKNAMNSAPAPTPAPSSTPTSVSQPRGPPNATLTTQVMEYIVDEGCGLFLLPEPVTCFRDALYKQTQRFHLKSRTSSLVLLDSITSGRQAMGEDWDFAWYYSLNEVLVGEKLLAKDVMLLDGQDNVDSKRRVPKRPLRDQLASYSCYAMVLLYGPQVQETVEDIAQQYKQEIVHQRRAPTESIWSFTLLGETNADGAVVRVAGKETELVRSCLKTVLRRLDGVVGEDTYKRAFA